MAGEKCIKGMILGQLKNYKEICWGDVWTTAWADDGNLYSIADDAGGFYSKANSNVCMNKIIGNDPYNLDGEMVNALNGDGEFGVALSSGPDGCSWKGMGVGFMDGVLYLAVSRHQYGGASTAMRQLTFNAGIVKSTDYGKTWTPSAQDVYDNPMFPGPLFSNPFFIDYGQNGNVPAGYLQPDGSDKYVYAISNDGYWNNGHSMRLGRVLRDKMSNLNPADWEFYKGIDGNLDGMLDFNWTKELNQAGTIVSEDDHMSMTGATYIPALGRYVMIQWHYIRLSNFDHYTSVFDFYEAPHPWGPWTKFQSHTWETYGAYNPTISSKFISPDGKNAVMIFNGDFMGSIPSDDYLIYSLHIMPITFITDEIIPGQLNNAAFERGSLSAWASKHGTSRVVKVPENPNNIKNAARLTENGDIVYQSISNLTPNTMYRLTGYTMSSNGGEGKVGVRDFGGEEKVESVTESSFIRKTIAFVTGLNTTHATVHLSKEGGKGEIFGSNFSIEPFIQDAGFESGDLKLHWSPVNAISLKENARTGKHSAILAGNDSSIKQTISGLQPNTTYRVTAYGMISNHKQDLWMSVSGYGGEERKLCTNSTEYTRMTVVFKTGPDNDSVLLMFSKSKGIGSSYVDDILLNYAVQNPDFESGTCGWLTTCGYEQMSFVQNPDLVHSGKVSCKLVHENKEVIGVPAENRIIWQVVDGLKPDTSYTLTAYARVRETGQEAVLKVKGYNGFKETSQVITSNTYTLVTIKFATGSSNTSVTIAFQYDGTEGAAYGDNFMLQED